VKWSATLTLKNTADSPVEWVKLIGNVFNGGWRTSRNRPKTDLRELSRIPFAHSRSTPTSNVAYIPNRICFDLLRGSSLSRATSRPRSSAPCGKWASLSRVGPQLRCHSLLDRSTRKVLPRSRSLERVPSRSGVSRPDYRKNQGRHNPAMLPMLSRTAGGTKKRSTTSVHAKSKGKHSTSSVRQGVITIRGQ
jgi:hypothetical protein